MNNNQYKSKMQIILIQIQNKSSMITSHHIKIFYHQSHTSLHKRMINMRLNKSQNWQWSSHQPSRLLRHIHPIITQSIHQSVIIHRPRRQIQITNQQMNNLILRCSKSFHHIGNSLQLTISLLKHRSRRRRCRMHQMHHQIIVHFLLYQKTFQRHPLIFHLIILTSKRILTRYQIKSIQVILSHMIHIRIMLFPKIIHLPILMIRKFYQQHHICIIRQNLFSQCFVRIIICIDISIKHTQSILLTHHYRPILIIHSIESINHHQSPDRKSQQSYHHHHIS